MNYLNIQSANISASNPFLLIVYLLAYKHSTPIKYKNIMEM